MLALSLFIAFETLIPQCHNFFGILRRNISVVPILAQLINGGGYEFFRYL